MKLFWSQLELRLVDNWRQAWKWGSVQLALLAGAVSGWAASDPNGFARVMDMLPEWARPLLGLGLAMSAISARIASVRKTNG